MKNFTLLTALLALGLAPALQAAPQTTEAPEVRTFTAALPAPGINSLKLQFSVGEATVKAGDGNTIRVHVSAKPADTNHFIFTWVKGKGEANKLPPNLRLIHKQEGDTLTLCLGTTDQCGGSDDRDWKDDWAVTVPARLQVSIEGDVGKASVAGVAGGLNLDMDVGKFDIQAPCGPIHAQVNVGKIAAQVAASVYGKIRLSTDVGDVDFSVDGHNVDKGKNRNVTSSSQSLQGTGSADYILSVDTGGIDLALGDGDVASSPLCTTPSQPATTPSAATTHAH